MYLTLNPRVYKRNFKWGVATSNKIDTVAMRLVDPYKISSKSENIDTVSVVIEGQNFALPISLTQADTYHHVNNNNTTTSPKAAQSQVGVVMASGSVTFNLSTPINTQPVAKLHLHGTTYFTNRGQRPYTTMENIPENDLAYRIYNMADGSESWTDKSSDSTNRGSTGDSTLVDYTADSIPLYAWVRKLFPADEGYLTVPKESEVLTAWNPSSAGQWGIVATSMWDDYDAIDSVLVWPHNPSVSDNRIALKNATVQITTRITKIDDYTFKVDFNAPVRYSYLAYAGPNVLGTGESYDNYCFLDRVSNITVELIIPTIETTTQNISLSLDSAGELTDVPVAKRIYSYNSNEFTNTQAYWGNSSELWYRKMATYLLDRFKNDKFIVTCDVLATWALQNDVHVNTRCNVYLPDGTIIARDGTPCTFEVKTIEKRFNESEFIFSLRLMEV